MALQGLVGFILSYLNRKGFLPKSGTESGTEKENPLIISGFLWCWEESNCRHMDFQSIALPSELQHHLLGMQRYSIFPTLQTFLEQKHNISIIFPNFEEK